MIRTIEAPIIEIPITIIHDTQKGFNKYIKKYIDDEEGDCAEGYNGLVSLRQHEVTGQFKIVVWFADNGRKEIVNYKTIIHESFHVACRIRSCMYGLADELEINPDNEEDWAYLFEETARKIFDVVDSMQKQYDKKHEVKANDGKQAETNKR